MCMCVYIHIYIYIYIYKTIHAQNCKINIFFQVHLEHSPGYITFGTFSRLHYMLSYKTSLSKHNKTEIMPSILSNENNMRLEINYKENLKDKLPSGR